MQHCSVDAPAHGRSLADLKVYGSCVRGQTDRHNINKRRQVWFHLGDINSAYTGTGIPADAQSVISRRSMNLQPVLYPAGHEDQKMSEFTARRSMGKAQTPRMDRQDHFQL